MANMVLGIQDPEDEDASQKFLLNTAILQSTIRTTIIRPFDIYLNFRGHISNEIQCFYSSQMLRMVKAAGVIQFLYPKKTCITSLAHAPHYPTLDRFISKSSASLQPDLPLFPQPITTRLGIWIGAVAYYAKNFDKFADFVGHLDEHNPERIFNV